ncbi:magnesium/cobalt transporter CorA [Halapricum desulfuricans]|uniref:Magnesium transport protein CorA n=1 Tax=Halapricum desulfuricans TaxID=2841257 RepID=A0A897N7K0_9EURY|nr:magnesium/cobalt transporter CorA [Halapricum desulfuricans]QSG07163.1 Mg2+ and Co2+ transporter [Halapricum desulfuricans]
MIESLVYRSGTVESYDDLGAARAAAGTTWVHATEVTDGERERIREAFELHPLAIEDVADDVRAKVEEFPGFTFVLLKTARLTRGETTFEEEIDTAPVGVFLGRDWIVSMTPGTAPEIGRVRTAVESGDERLLERGADFTAYRIVDALVDRYFDVLDGIETKIESIEDEVVTSTRLDVLDEINAVRRELLSFRKLLWPAREAVGTLASGDPRLVEEATEKYFRSVHDHLVQLVDLTETYRDLVSGARDIYLNTLSQSTNEVMKILTVVATVFIPLTFVAGIYGMNFEHMPELGWQWGYPVVLALMAAIAAGMMAFFRHRDYL